MPTPEKRRNRPSDASNENRGAVPTTATDKEVIEEAAAGCQRGDPAAQRRLYELTHDKVYRLMMRMVGRQEAADVTQQAYLQVFRKIDQFAGRSQCSTWIYRIAVNEALQHSRRVKRIEHLPLEWEPADSSTDAPLRLDDRDLLEQALTSVDAELRSVFLLREIEGLSYGDISCVLEIPEGTVGSRLNRARRQLSRRLDELGWEP